MQCRISDRSTRRQSGSVGRRPINHAGLDSGWSSCVVNLQRGGGGRLCGLWRRRARAGGGGGEGYDE